MGSNSLTEFDTFTVPDRLNFLEEHFSGLLADLSEKQLNDFLSGIIGDGQENNYVRRKALNLFIDLVITGSLKTRHALTVLIDNWQDNAELFLEIQRLKDLYFFYDQEQDSIEGIFRSYLQSSETELVSESHFHLGLVNMQKGFMSDDVDQSRWHLTNSRQEFDSSSEIIENRSDAVIYSKAVEIVLDILNGVTESIKDSLKDLGQLLFQKEAFSFKIATAPFYVGFYRILNSLSKITIESPGGWLDFRQGLTNLFYQYSIIKNEEIKGGLNIGILSNSIIKKLESQILQPFFSLSFSAEKAKVNALLGEFATESPQAEFLLYLRDIAMDRDVKKKAESEVLLQQLQRIFKNISRSALEDIVEKIDEPRLSFRFLRAFELLVEPTSDQLTDKIISASLTLQSNRIYYGNYSEDDRNTFIASMLQSGGFNCKDQTRRSTSPSGKSAGEIDILIEDIQHNPIGIIEALNLSSIDTAYIQLHLDKIFTYDANGLKNNYIVVYANAKNFGTFYVAYKKFVSKHAFQYPLVIVEEQHDLPYTELKKLSTTHTRNDCETKLHHIIINLFKA